MADPYHDLLLELRDELRSQGRDAFLSVGNEEVPDQLFVELDPDAEGRQLQLQLMFLPAPAATPILQRYVGLPFTFTEENRGSLERFLLAANVVTPIGCFGLAAEHLLYYRYNAATAVDPLDLDLLNFSTEMAAYLVANIAPIIERVGRDADLDAALEELAAVVVLDTARAADPPSGFVPRSVD